MGKNKHFFFTLNTVEQKSENICHAAFSLWFKVGGWKPGLKFENLK